MVKLSAFFSRKRREKIYELGKNDTISDWEIEKKNKFVDNGNSAGKGKV